jgi:hypothetical protein
MFVTANHKVFDDGVKGFNLTKDHAYFFNEYNIWRFNLKTTEHEFSVLGLHVDKNDKQSKI